MNPLLDTSDEALTDWLQKRGHPVFRTRQIRRWLFQSRAEAFDEMTNLPKGLRESLQSDYQFWTGETLAHHQAADGTEKLVLQFPDRGQIECVLLRDNARRTICVSSQVGCAMGCVFCASGLDGVDRDLSTGEMLEQMLRLARLLPGDERLSHIVVMGMGEPMANLDHLLPALEQASHKDGLGVSPRRITISTVGLPQAMDRLTAAQPRYQLAVSLHAPNDMLRDQLVPVNRNIGLDAILASADRYFEASGRRLTFEYVLLAGINDAAEHAHQLTNLLRGRSALLNVIPYNPVAGLPYRLPSVKSQIAFRQILEAGGVNVQFRQRKGDDINAACGQLRRSQSVTTHSLTDSTKTPRIEA
jgi:23S rRNA (adenine2503-C2)-methyltransferase